MPRIIRLSVLSVVLAAAAYGAGTNFQNEDCDVIATTTGNSLFSPHTTTIRIKLPFPGILKPGVYFDGILAADRDDGTWDIIFLNGNHNVGEKDNLPGDTVKNDIDMHCPGLGDRLTLQNTQLGELGAGATIPHSGQASQNFVMKDFDGDGIQDIVGVDGRTATVSLLKADNTSRTDTAYTAGPGLSFVVAGDFNGDGRLDLIVSASTGTTNATASILLGNGGGTFQAAQTLAAGPDPSALAIADFNGDGKLDLVVGNTNGISVLLGNGNGTFQSPVSYPTAFLPGSIVVDDFTGDGKLDIVVLNLGTNTVSTLRGNGNGTFQPAVTSPGGLSKVGFLGYIAYSDLNHDGKLDLLIRYPSNDVLSLLLGNGDGTFQSSRDYVAPENSSALGIVPNKDGSFLILLRDRLTSDVALITAPGDGTIGAPPIIQLGGTLTGIAAGDFNGDGRNDLVVAKDNRVVVLTNNQTNSFQSPVSYTLPTSATGIAVGDLNGDHRPDVVVTLASGNVGVFLTTPLGFLDSLTTYAVGASPSHPILADFDGDGKLDLAAIADGRVYVLFGNGDGSFQAPLPLGTGASNVYDIAAGDFNGDHRTDIAAVLPDSSAFGPGKVGVYLLGANRTFGNPILTPLPAVGAVAAGDFNGDGKLDVAVTQLSTGGIAILAGTNDGKFGAPNIVPTYDGGIDLKAADIDGDGILDLLNTACCGDSNATYLLGYGNGTFQAEVDLTSGNDPGAAVLTDLNGDGKLDVAFTNAAGSGGYVTAFSFGFPNLVVVSSAAPFYRIAPASMASAYGPILTNPALNGTKVTVKDTNGVSRDATTFYYVAKGQINFVVPASTAVGTSQVTVTSSSGTKYSTNVTVAAVVPALFPLNTSRLVAANVLRVHNGVSTYEDLYQVSNGAVVPKPIDFGPAGDQIYLLLYGTGLRAAGTQGVTVTIGGSTVQVLYAGPQGTIDGFDQVNVQVPRSLAGKGPVNLVLTANGVVANTVNLTFK